MWVAFALQKLLTFFQQKFQHICVSLNVNFNESLTNDIVSFEQLGPDHQTVQADQSLLAAHVWRYTFSRIQGLAFHSYYIST